MKFRGDIASIPIADVVQNLSANRKSGILTVHLEEQTRRVTFGGGKIVCYSDNAGFSVIDWIEEKCLVDAESFQKAIKRYRRTRRKSLGVILEEVASLPEEAYCKHVRSLVHDLVCETLSFRQGTFEFVENSQDEKARVREVLDAGIELPVGEVLMDAARRMDEWEAIRNSLPSENDIYRVQPVEVEALLQKFKEDPVTQEAIRLLDGTRSIREVISLIPSGRFYASRAVAQLVAMQKARPVDGTELVAQADQGDTAEHRARTLVRLKAALEREPSNQVLLGKVAELCEKEGKTEAAAVYHKLLALQLRDAGKLAEAERELRTSLELNARDISAWQKLYELVEERAELEQLLEFSGEYARNLRKLGFEELARDHLAQVVRKHPGALELRLEYADTLFSLGDKNGAVDHLLELANEHIQAGNDADAEDILARVIEYDNHHKQAREIFEQIRTGALERRRQRRRSLIRSMLAATALSLLGVYVGYDFYVRREFALTLRQVFAEGLIEKGEYQKASERVNTVLERHPSSLLRFLEGGEFLKAMKEANLRKMGLPSSPRSGDPVDPEVPGGLHGGKH